MDKDEYVKLCTALYGQLRYRSFVNMFPEIYHSITVKPDFEKLYFVRPDGQGGTSVDTIYGYTCPLYTVYNNITYDYKLAPGYEITMVLLVVVVNTQTTSYCVILEIIENIFKEYINDVF